MFALNFDVVHCAVFAVRTGTRCATSGTITRYARRFGTGSGGNT